MKFNFLPLLSVPNKNALMTKGTFGYEWWYHSMIGYNEKTNESRAFFMEYCIMNPNKTDTTIPSYLMIKAGTYNKDPHEINNFYNLENVTIGKDSMEVILHLCTFKTPTFLNVLIIYNFLMFFFYLKVSYDIFQFYYKFL
jgi:hypothetical protein